MDRIDLHGEVPALAASDLLQAAPGQATESMRQRCTQAREWAHQRQGKTNAALHGKEIDQHTRLDEAASKFLNVAATRLGWSARGTHRVLKVARTIADLAQAETLQVTHLAEAMQYRPTLHNGR